MYFIRGPVDCDGKRAVKNLVQEPLDRAVYVTSNTMVPPSLKDSQHQLKYYVL